MRDAFEESLAAAIELDVVDGSLQARAVPGSTDIIAE